MCFSGLVSCGSRSGRLSPRVGNHYDKRSLAPGFQLSCNGYVEVLTEMFQCHWPACFAVSWRERRGPVRMFLKQSYFDHLRLAISPASVPYE